MNITTKTVHATINCAVTVALLLAASLHAHATDVNGVTEQTVTNNSLTNPLTIENGGILDLNGTTQTVTTTTLGTGGSTLETTNGASMLTSTTVIVQGAGNVVGTLLTLAGPITQNANSGLTVAGTAGSDTLASNAILAGTGSTGALILNGATVSPGTGASPTGNLTVASATFNSNSTLAMTLSSSASSELVVTGAATINGTNSITFTGSTGATTTTGQGNYVLATATSGLTTAAFTGTAPTDYQLLGTGTQLNLTHQATIGTITATPTAASIITGGTDAFTIAVPNTAPSGSSSLSAGATAGTNVTGSIAANTITTAPGVTSTNYSGLTFNGTTVGIGQTGSFTVSDPKADNTPQTGTVTVNVYDHAASTAAGGVYAGGTLTLPNVRVGYMSTNSTNSLTVTNGAITDTRVNLKGSATAVGNVSLSPISAVTPGSAGTITATLAPGNAAGAISVPLTYNFADDSALSGNGSDGSATITVNGGVYALASPTLNTASPVALGNVRVTATAPTGSVSITNTSTAPTGYQDSLDATATTNNGKVTGNSTNITAGNTGTLTLTANTTTAGSLASSVTLGYVSNANNVTGLSNTTLTSGTIATTGGVYDYANPTINTTSPVAFGFVHQHATNPAANVSISNTTITNASYQDSLDAAPTANNTSVTGTGFTALLAGSSPGTVTLTANTATAGSLASTVNLGLVSDTNGVAGLVGKNLSGSINTTGEVYSGLSVWNTNSGGSWGQIAGTGSTAFGANWGTNQGSPGLDSNPNFTSTDTATFGTALTSGSATVTLDGANPSLNAITFNDSNANTSYTIGQGTGGTISLNGGGSAATVTNTNGNNTISAPVSLTTSANVNVANGQQLTISGVVSGSGNLSIAGSGNLILTNGNNYRGSTTISTGTLQLGDGTANTGALLGTSSISLVNNGTLAIDRTGATTQVTDLNNQPITGSGNLLQMGSGTTTLTLANNYSGATTISAGTLQLGDGIGNTGSLTGTTSIVDNGTLAIDRTGGVTQATDLNNNVISGTGNLLQTGSGTTTLNLANTYMGSTTVYGGGKLQNGVANALPTGTVLTLGTSSETSSTTNTYNLSGNNQTLAALNTSGSGNDIVTNTGTSTLTLSGTNSDGTPVSSNFGGSIDGSGNTSLAITGGTHTFSGANNYTGGTTISGSGNLVVGATNTLPTAGAVTLGESTGNTSGTLQLGTSSSAFNQTLTSLTTAGSGSANDVVGGNSSSASTLTVNNSSTDTFSGTLGGGSGATTTQNNLALTKIGAGNLILTNTNTYTGPTTITEGTLEVDGSVDPRSTVAVGTAGTLAGSGTVNGNATLTGSGVINLGSTGKIGGTLAVTGGNWMGAGSVTGAVNQTSGTFTIGSGANLTTGGGLNVNASSTLAGSGTVTGVTTLTGGTIAGTGNGLTLGNQGSVAFSSGTNTVGGAKVNNVSINSGAIVNQVGPLTLQSTSASSATSSGTINVSQGQILNNYGTLNGTGTITLKLGLSPGTYQASAPDNTIGIYKSIQLVTSNTSTPTSYINGNGSGKLNGQTVSLDSSILNLQGGQAVLIAQNEVLSNTTLSFAQPQSNLLVAKEVTSGGSTYLMLTLNPNLVFSGPSAPYYQSFTGAYINGNLNAILAVQNHPNDLIHQVNATETVQAATSIGFNGFSPHISNLSLRLTDARDGKNGFSASNTGEGLAGPSGDEGKSGGDFLTPSPDNRWGVFLTGIGDFAKTDSADGYTGYNTTQAGFTLGADYRLTPNLIVGALAGFAHEHAGFADGSTLSIDGAKFGVYGTAFTGGFYLNAAVLGGYDTFDSHRVDIGGAIAKGSSDAEEIATFLGAGYDFTMGNFKIGPTSSFQYERSFTNGFAETGGTVPLEYPDQSTGAITTKVGSKMSYSFKVLGCQFTPELRTEWEHDFRATIPVDFAVPQGPTVQDLSPRVGLDSLSLVAGASAQVSQSVTVYLYYNGDLLRQNYTENDVSGGVRCSF